MNRLRASIVVRYGLAVGLVALAEWLRTHLPAAWAVPHWSLLFAPAVLISALFGGVGPGLVATTGSVAAVAILVVHVTPSLNMGDSMEILVLVMFAAIGLAISLVAGANRRDVI